MTPGQAIAFVKTHGVVMESANGPLPSLVQAIVGEKVHGSWWAHPEGKRIFEITRAVRSSPEVLVCRLVGGKITLVHEKRCHGQFSRWGRGLGGRAAVKGVRDISLTSFKRRIEVDP